MTYTVAICGKGGTGKTTFSSLLLKEFLRRGWKPVLVIDADADGNLVEALGLNGAKTLGEVVDYMQKNISQFPPGFSKDSWLEAKIAEILVEEKGYDLLVMGKGEGPGCYCYVNSVLRSIMERISNSYPYVIMDNAAGMEHLSRRTTRKADILFIVSDHSKKGIHSGIKIAELARSLELDIKDIGFVINMVKGDVEPSLLSELEEKNMKFFGVIPEDEEIRKFDMEGRSLLDLPETSISLKAVKEIIDKAIGAV